MKAVGGTCGTCEQDLVQVYDDEGGVIHTYHPADSITDVVCEASLPIEGTDLASFDTPAEEFVPDA